MKSTLSIIGVLILATLLIPVVHESSHVLVANYTGNEVVSMGYNYTEVYFKNEASKPIVYISGFIFAMIVGCILILVGRLKGRFKGKFISIAGMFWLSSCLIEFSLGTDFARTMKMLDIYNGIFFLKTILIFTSLITLAFLFRRIYYHG